MNSVMTHEFSAVPEVGISRSKFERPSGYKTTFNAGYLIPFFVDEVLPGDTFEVDASFFVRMASALDVPVMDNMFLDSFFFYVADRLVWPNFKKFMGEQNSPNDSTDYLVPVIKSGNDGFAVGSVFDYAGLPVNVPNLEVNAMPFIGMLRIYDEWFRDENLQSSLYLGNTAFEQNPDGPFDKSLFPLMKRGKRHDYFTSCLPWPQKGPAVDIPLGTTAPVRLGNGLPLTGATDGNGSPFMGTLNFDASYGLRVALNPRQGLVPGTDTTMYADLSGATAATINSLRQAFQLQKFYERQAVSGSRYTEILQGMFEVDAKDYRLQRTEYLGGHSERIDVFQVPQTSATAGDSSLASLGAYVTCRSNGNGFTKSFVEHGYIIGFVNVRCDLTYQQGIERMYSRQSKVDFYWPLFAHLGEQAVLNKEIYAQGNASDNDVFGYQERYAEYRYKPSKITGKLRSGLTDSLDVYHFSDYFENLPALNSDFIEDSADRVINRVVVVQDEPQFILDAFIKNDCIRPMPVYGVPGLVDHF